MITRRKKFTVCCRFSSKNYFVRSKYHVAQKGVPYQISWCPKNYFTRHDTKISFCFVIQKYHVMIQNYHFVLSKYHVAQKKGNLVDSEKILRSSADGLTRGVKSLLRRVSDFRPTLLLLVASGLLLNCLFRCSVGMLFACFRHSWRNSGISSHASLLPHFRFL